MTAKMVKKYCKLDDDAEDLLGAAMSDMALSARAHNKILKVARTVADLEDNADSERIRSGHLSEAIQYRTPDRALWR